MRNYYLSQVGDIQLTEHISLAELQCDSKRDLVMVCDELLDYVEQLMTKVSAVKIVITSGNRDEIDVANGIGNATDQHQTGRAIDCKFFKEDGTQISPQYICCIAQDMGFEGIGNMRTATHLDRRVSGIWHGDELNNDRNVSDFYSYLGISRDEPIVEPVPEVSSDEDIVIDEGDVRDMNESAIKYEMNRVALTHLHREFSEEDLNANYNELMSGKSWKWFTDTIQECDEAISLWIKDTLYQGILGYGPSDADLSFWVSLYQDKVWGIGTDLTKKAMIDGFTSDYDGYKAIYVQRQADALANQNQ